VGLKCRGVGRRDVHVEPSSGSLEPDRTKTGRRSNNESVTFRARPFLGRPRRPPAAPCGLVVRRRAL